MSLLREFSQAAPNRIFIAVLLGGLSGMSYAALIPLVLGALQTPPLGLEYGTRDVARVLGLEVASPRLAATFFAACFMILLARIVSQTMLTRVSMELTTAMRMRLYERILGTPYAVIEGIGSARLTLAVLEDVRRIVAGAQKLPDLIIGSVTILGMLGLLLFLDLGVFVFVIEALVFAFLTYQIPMSLVDRRLRRARELYDELSRAIRGLIHGIKELKLSGVKRATYLDKVLRAQESEFQSSQRQATSIMAALNSYGDMLGFIVIGVLAFCIVNYRSISQDGLIVIIMSLLYLSGPVALITNALPALMAARVSFDNIGRLFGELSEQDKPAAAQDGGSANWNRIELSEVRYRHRGDAHRDGFEIGPIDMEIRKGEITFIAGGNGSGKSTLGKIITLLYEPSSGSIRFDDERIEESCADRYRRGISAIFTDYHLFDRLLGDLDSQKLASAQRHIEELGLSSQVSVGAAGFSTVELSDGQKKRLALVAAFLDDSQLYLFDEWAADQDPVFKQRFYTQVLPRLKAQGKAVVVISHDDRYFESADRIFFMEHGRIVRHRARGEE